MIAPVYSVTAFYHAQHSIHGARLAAIDRESVQISRLIVDAPPARRAYYQERWHALRDEYNEIVLRYQAAIDAG